MSTRKIKDAKDLESNELIYFKGHAKATFMGDGRSVEETVEQAKSFSTETKIMAEQASIDATIAKNAVATLEGLANADEAMQTLAGQVVQIEENKQKLSELGSKFGLSSGVTFDNNNIGTDNTWFDLSVPFAVNSGESYTFTTNINPPTNCNIYLWSKDYNNLGYVYLASGASEFIFKPSGNGVVEKISIRGQQQFVANGVIECEVIPKEVALVKELSVLTEDLEKVKRTLAENDEDIDEVLEETASLASKVKELDSMYTLEGNFYTGENVEGYMNSGGGFAGTASSLANARSSVMIPVIGGKVYCISGRPENSAVCCYDEYGNMLKPLAAINSAERSDFYLPSIDGSSIANNGQFKMPDNAVSFRFGITLYGVYTEDKNKIVLEIVGEEYDENFIPTTFRQFGTHRVLAKEAFSSKILNDIKTGNNKFTLKDCSLLVVSAASHGEGFGSIKDKSFISYFSALIDYNVENYSASGSNSINHFNMLMKNSNIVGVKPSDLGQRGGYVIIAHGGDNEAGYFRNGVDGKYYEMNLIRECKAWESLGFKPILSGYWGEQSTPWATMVQSVAKKYGYKYININASNYRFYRNIYEPWWYNTHFGTRTCAMQWYSLLGVLNWLPKPKQSIKIFRPRLAGQSLDNLLFDNEYERLEKWIELSLHHEALLSGKENYVDRLDLYKNEIGSLDHVASEYATLRNGGSVSIAEKALVRIVLPKVNVSGLTIKPVVDGDIRLYARLYRDNSLAVESGIPSAIYTLHSAEGIVEGDVFTDSNNSGVSFTVVDINSNTITCTASAEFVTEGNMAGTLTGSNGTYNYTHLGKGPGSNYFSEIVRPIGKWVEVSKKEDVYSIANPTDYIDYDSIDLCLVGSNFSISDIEVVYDGGIDKNVDNTFDKHCLNEDKFVGENILTISNFNNAATDWNVSGNYTLWDGVTSLGNHIPTYYKNQKGVTSILRLNKGAKVSQSVEMKGNTDLKVKTYKVKIVARYYPEEYSDVNSEPSNGITAKSYDIGKLGITVKIGHDELNSYYTDTLYIPTTFCEIEKEYTFDGTIVANQEVTFEALTDRIELLYCEVFE